LSFDISKEMLELGEGVLFINADHVNPVLLGQWRGRHAYLGHRVPWTSDFNVKNIKVSGPTVTNTTLAMAIDMGFSQIILGGVDLCHNPEGYTHASGSNEHRAGPFLGHVGQWVETNAGEMAETEESLAQAVHDIGAQAKYAQSRGCLIFNPARNAAKIPNVFHFPLADISIEPLEQPAQDIITKALPQSSRETRKKYYQYILNELTPIISQLREVRKLAEEALECNEGLFGRDGIEADFKYKIRMDKIEHRLNNKFKHISPLVKKFGIRRFLRVVRPDRDKEWSDEEIEQTGRIYYESYCEGADAMLAAVEQARQRVLARIGEEQDSPDFTLLLSQWRKDNQPGRARVWRSRHADRFIPEQYQPDFDQLVNDLNKILKERDTGHVKKCQNMADLSSVQSKALMLFKHHDIASLKRLNDSLQKHSSHEAHQFRDLVAGYLAELEEDDDTALEFYQIIPEGPLLEDALRRICSLTLKHNDYHNATLALDCLSSLSPDYMPMLAELLRISGQIQQAANIYAEYLEQVPDDLVTLLKLGQLYIDEGVIDGAKWVYDYILKLEPENQVAHPMLRNLEKTSSEDIET
jgi:hypothetical protein